MKGTSYTLKRFSGGIPAVMRSDGIYLSANKGQRLVNHSPDGFEWGYGGSGPAQLALSILLDYTEDKRWALENYQAFKWEYIAPVPRAGDTITAEGIEAFIGRMGLMPKG